MFLLTGGVEVDDVSFDRKMVTFHPNNWRRLKNKTSWRVVPLWPQLEEILRAYTFGPRLRRPGKLLFPSFVDGEEAKPEFNLPAAVVARLAVPSHRAARRWPRAESRARHRTAAAPAWSADRTTRLVSAPLGSLPNQAVAGLGARYATFVARKALTSWVLVEPLPTGCPPYLPRRGSAPVGESPSR